jgi:hypothetical protein
MNDDVFSRNVTPRCLRLDTHEGVFEQSKHGVPVYSSDDAIEGRAEVDAEAGNALLEGIEISLNGSVNKSAQLIEARTNRAE